jgi:hypothetical protein
LLGTLSQSSVASLQVSIVHETPSLQFGVEPAWQSCVTWHVSTPLQNSPSSQAPLSAMLSQPSVLSLQESTVQLTASSQAGGVPDRQSSVGWQTSVPLQNRPSLHAPLFGTCEQSSAASLQLSVVHETPSSQFGTAPATHEPAPLQVSLPLQCGPSPQAVPLAFAVATQVPLPASQLPTLQASSRLEQSRVLPEHWPDPSH